MSILAQYKISKGQLLSLISLLFLVVVIPLLIYLVRQQQILKGKASEGTRIEFVDSNGNPITTTANRNVKLNLTYVLSTSSSVSSFNFIKTAFALTVTTSKPPSHCCSGIAPPGSTFKGFPPAKPAPFSCPAGATYGPSGNVNVDSDNAPLDSTTCQARYGAGCDCASACTTTQEERSRGDDTERWTAYHCKVNCTAAGPTSASFNIDAKPGCNPDGTYQGYIKINGWPQTSTVTVFRRRAGTNNFEAVATQPGSSDPRCANLFIYDSPDSGGFPYEYYANDSSGQSSNVATVQLSCPKLGIIQGTVFLDKNKNGIQDAGESLFGNASVSVIAKNVSTGQEISMITNRAGYPAGSFLSTNSSPGHAGDSSIGTSYLDQGNYQLTVTLPEGYTVTNSGALSVDVGLNTTVNIGVIPPPTYPTHFRIANDQTSLASAPARTFNPPSQTIDWVLPAGLGLKTVYAQFRVDNVWGPVLSAQIALTAPTASTLPSPSVSLSPSPSGSPSSSLSPSPSCLPRPACLSGNPACAIAEPAQGWCPTLPSPSPATFASPPSFGSISLPGSSPTPIAEVILPPSSRPSSIPTPNIVERITNPVTQLFDQLLGRQSQTQTQTQTQPPLPPAASSVPVARSISSTPINFDLNADGKINSADIAILLNDWRNNIKSPKDDFNKDGIINTFDYALLRGNL